MPVIFQVLYRKHYLDGAIVETVQHCTVVYYLSM